MTEHDFLRKIEVIKKRIINDYWDGDDITGDVRAIELLCHNFIEIKKMKDKENNKI